jgi:hypothetical protein
MPDTMFRQEYLADFVIFEGAVYGQLIEPQIIRTREKLQELIPEWPEIASWRQVYVGLDTGADHPFGALKVVTSDNGLVVVGEYLDRDKTFVQHAAEIKRLANSSTAKFAINKNERQPILELGQHGIWCQGAENEVVAGTERVKSWLCTKQLWFVEALCPQTIKQMQALRWANKEASDGSLREKEKVYKKNDELPDCLRYICMVYPLIPKPPVEEKDKPRDLTKYPDETRATIERMRRIEGRKKEPESTVLDFYA